MVVAICMVAGMGVYVFSYSANNNDPNEDSTASITSMEHNGIYTYYENSDGTWTCKGITYSDRLVLTGTTGASQITITYYVLTNNPSDLDFRKVNSSLYSSNSNDLMKNKESIIVDILN